MAPASTDTAKLIRAARTDRGWSVADLASRSGVSYKTIERIEGGHVAPHPATLKVISDALELEAA